MKTYLSIDLDYWNGGSKKSINAFFAHVFGLELPLWIAPLHHQLVPDINHYPHCDTLINVDYHSDISDVDDRHPFPLTEGTWANFVLWQRRGTYIWRFPHTDCLTPDSGYCHLNANPFKNAACTNWRRVIQRQGLSGIPWHTIKAIGISLSSFWVEKWRNPLVPITERLGIRHWLDLDSTEQALVAKPFLRKVA